jgi:glutamate/aspartate transport system substrate-binding protein
MRGVSAAARQAAAGLAACALLAMAPAAAQGSGGLVVTYASPTLKRIDETATVRLGHRTSSPPFAFLDAARKPIGYSLDICEVVVDEISREVGKPLSVEWRAVTP